jgi:hypothetical protein
MQMGTGWRGGAGRRQASWSGELLKKIKIEKKIWKYTKY